MIEFLYYPLAQAHEAQGVAVIIDVLRAFTTAAFAFNAGADKIYPVAAVAEAIQLSDKLPGSLIMGEVNGIKPEGFDFGNSPYDISRIDLTGKMLIQRTSAIRSLNPPAVSFIITGISLGRDGDEDLACAEYIEALVKNKCPDARDYIKRVTASSVGRVFLDGRNTNFQFQDLTLSIQVDRFPYPLKVTRENGRLVMDHQFPV